MAQEIRDLNNGNNSNGRTHPDPPDVLIVSEQAVTRAGMRVIIEEGSRFEVCGEEVGAAEALEVLRKQAPALMVIDMTLGEGSVFELVKQAEAEALPTRILVLTLNEDAILAERIIQAGALGFITKSECEANIIVALEKIHSGKMFVSEEVSERILVSLANRPREAESSIDALSDRELEVFNMLGQGLATKEIADHLHLSVKTIETHRAHIKEKMGLRNHSELIREAIRYVENC